MDNPTAAKAGVRLTVGMIVRDEEDVLAESLESVLAIADELLVLDTGSTDRTTEVAQRLGARVIRAPWTDDFASARNRLLSEAAGDWILWLDAGERLDGESAGAIRRCVDEEVDRGNVYLVLVEVPPPLAGASSEQVAQARLMPRRADLRFEGRLRETLRPSMERAGLGIGAVGGIIRRHPRQHDPRRKADRARRNLRVVELAATETASLSASLLLARAEALADLDRPAEARAAFHSAIEASERGSGEMLEGYYGLLTCAPAEQSDQTDQIALCLRALDIYPLDAQLLLAMGNYLQARGTLDLAARSFRVAVDHGQVNLEVWHLAELAEVAIVCLSLVLQLQGKDDEAAELLNQAIERFGHSVRTRRHAMDLHVKHGRADEADRLARKLPVEPGQRVPLRAAVRGACLAAVKDWLPALGYLQSAYVAGCQDTLCLRWLAITLLSNGQPDAAEGVLRQWHEREPHNPEAKAYLEAIFRQPADSDSHATPSETSRFLRIDPATTVMEVCAPRSPFVVRASTADPLPESTG
ncbi:MAG: glycosyltransferase [Planctomycetia bacterium]|nr:glycosyltransferase [Planctomycetia bacterium]